MDAVKKVISFFHTGTISISVQDAGTIEEVKMIISTLDISIGTSQFQAFERNETINQSNKSDTTKAKVVTVPNEEPDRREKTKSPNVSNEPSMAVDNPNPGIKDRSVLFSCQFCGIEFAEFLDLSEHIQGHFLEQEQIGFTTYPEKEQDQRSNVVVVVMKKEPQELTTSSIELVPESEQHVDQKPIDRPEVPRADNGRRKKLAQNVKLRKNGDSGKKERLKDKSAEHPTNDCLFCEKPVSTQTMQLERHLAVSHYSKKLIKIFGSPKQDCPICGKCLASRRGWLTHLLVLHTNLPKSIEAVREAALKNPSFINLSTDDDEILEERPSKRLSRAEKQAEKRKKKEEKRMKKEEEKQRKIEEKMLRREAKKEELKIKMREERKLKKEEKQLKKESEMFKCLKCTFSGSSYYALVIHTTQVHFEDVKDSICTNIENNETCKLCSKKYRTFGSLTHHLAKVHGVLERFLTGRECAVTIPDESQSSHYYCPECPQVLESYVDVIDHLANVHLKALILSHSKADNVCGICDRSFSKFSPMAYHLLTGHRIAGDSIQSRNILMQKRNLELPKL